MDGRRPLNLNPARRTAPAMNRSVGLSELSVGAVSPWCSGVTGCERVGFDAGSRPPTHLQRARVFLAAGDYRRAVEACRQEVQEHPSARSYLYLTYVYQALDAYVESLAKADHWVGMEHLYLNLTSGRPEELLDPPNVLARMAKR